MYHIKPSHTMFIRWYRSYRRVSIDSSDDIQSESTVFLDEKQPENIQQYRSFTLVPRNIIYPVVTICGIAILVAIGVYGLHATKDKAQRDKTQNNDQIQLCGNSSAEALSLGCSFDQLTWAWYPPHCPHYANDEFLNAEPESPWRYYDDPHSREAVAGEDWTKALDNQKELWGERREH